MKTMSYIKIGRFIVFFIISFFLFSSCSGVVKGSKVAIKNTKKIFTKSKKLPVTKPTNALIIDQDDFLYRSGQYILENPDDLVNTVDVLEGYNESEKN